MNTSYLIDPRRKERTHVVGVHGRDGRFFIDLSDGTWLPWESWVAHGGRTYIGGPSYPRPSRVVLAAERSEP